MQNSFPLLFSFPYFSLIYPSYPRLQAREKFVEKFRKSWK